MLKKYLPIILSLFLLGIIASIAIVKKDTHVVIPKSISLGNFSKQQSCARDPNFLQKLKIPQPIAIDLSQQQHKGLAFLYGQNLSKALHLKTWEKFDHFSTYALDPKGNMFLSPMPFISVNEHTFKFQKNIYKLDSNSGKLSIWMSLDEVDASGNNPFGVIALDYDCDDDTLWVSSIDKTDYDVNRGVIYHIDIKSKKILQRIAGIDALSMKLIKSDKGKYLLLGGARENSLDTLKISEGKASLKVLRLLTLPNENEHIRKIKVRTHNFLELQTIPFSYTLISETSSDSMRKRYSLRWDNEAFLWDLSKL